MFVQKDANLIVSYLVMFGHRSREKISLAFNDITNLTLAATVVMINMGTSG